MNTAFKKIYIIWRLVCALKLKCSDPLEEYLPGPDWNNSEEERIPRGTSSSGLDKPAGPAAAGWTNPQVFPIGQKVREILLLILFLSKSFLLITLWHEFTSCSACFLLCQLAVTFSLIYRDDSFSHYFHTIRNIQLKKTEQPPSPIRKVFFPGADSRRSNLESCKKL